MASHGQSIGNSQMYGSASGRDKGILSLMTHAGTSKMVDTTG